MTCKTQICPDPIFIVGSPGSGLGILAWSLAQHGRLWTSNESHLLSTLFGNGHVEHAFEVARTIHQDTWLRREGVGREEFLKYVGFGINALFTNRSRGKRWVDYTPDHARMVDILGDMFPGAYFLHILRDGREVVDSIMRFSDKPTNRLGSPPPRANSFVTACRTWRIHTTVATDFCLRNPTRCLTVRYEELVANPQSGIGEICQFLRVPLEDQLVDFFRSRIKSSFGSDSPNQVKKEQYSEPWKIWTPRERMTFYWEAGPALLRHGFATRPELDALADIEE